MKKNILEPESLLKEIPDGVYAGAMKLILRRNYYDSQVINSLILLMNSELTDEGLKLIMHNEDHVLNDSQYLRFVTNKEIKARWSDYLFQTNHKDKQTHNKEAVENYFEVYNKTKETKYLTRGLVLIRKAKSLHKSKLDEICHFAVREIKLQ